MTCGSISKIPLMLNLIILDRISSNVFRAWLLQFTASKSISINHFLFWRWELSCGELISSPFTSCFVVYSHPTSTLKLWNTRQYKVVQSDTKTVESPLSSVQLCVAGGPTNHLRDTDFSFSCWEDTQRRWLSP